MQIQKNQRSDQNLHRLFSLINHNCLRFPVFLISGFFFPDMSTLDEQQPTQNNEDGHGGDGEAASTPPSDSLQQPPASTERDGNLAAENPPAGAAFLGDGNVNDTTESAATLLSALSGKQDTQAANNNNGPPGKPIQFLTCILRDDRFRELRKKMKQKLSNNANFPLRDTIFHKYIGAKM